VAAWQESSTHRNDMRVVFAWCSPCLLAFALFLFSPSIGRLPFWPRWSIAETLFFWDIFIAPLATVIAFLIFLRRRRHIASFTRKLGWTMLTITLLVNGFMLLALWFALSLSG
jgi:hypothetical protein